jgi:drug/metabolite transporter (DMT)-like permease
MDLTKKSWQWVILLFLSFVWGTSFILMKKGLESYTHHQVGAFRLFFAFLIFLPVSIPRLRRINRKNLKSLLIVGFIGNGLPAFLFTKAQTQIDSAIAGILNSLTPLFTLLIGLIFYRSKVMIINIVGIFLGLMGAIGLVYRGSSDLFNQANWFAIFIVIATLCYGISVNEIKYMLQDMDGVTIACLGFFLVGPFAGLSLLFTDFSHAVSTPDYLQNLGFIAILALFSSAVAIAVFNILIKYTTTIFATSVTYITPIFAIFWGIFDGEKITLDQLLWVAIILVGVYLVNKQKLVTIQYDKD